MKTQITILLVVLTLLIIPTVLADTIADSTITVKVYNTTNTSKNSFLMNVEVINGDYRGNNKNFSMNVTKNKAISGSFDFKFQLIQNATIANLDYLNNYMKCAEEKIGFERAWQNCQNKIVDYEGANVTKCKVNLETCNLNLKTKDLDIGSLNEKIANMETEKKSSSNSKWFFGIAGLIIGYLICSFQHGKLGDRIKERSLSEFNRQQAS